MAFVDETGDRGVGAKSSPYFGMAAVVLAEEDLPGLQQTIIDIRTRLKVPREKALHWTEHVKKFARRQFVADQLATTTGVIVNYVLFEKAAIPQKARILDDQIAFYNYTAGIMMERLLLTANYWPDGPRSIAVQFGHVRGFKHESTLQYFEMKRRSDHSPANWSVLERVPTFVHATQNAGVQAADQYAGILKAAMEPNEFGGFEHFHLLRVSRQVRRSRTGAAWGYGFKVLGTPGLTEALPWWPTGGL